MPSAATKPDTKPQFEGESAIKQALNVIDKKVRNLEKRKTKLDSYRAKKPADLNDDQREAIVHYEEVIANLEFARELQKQFIQINTDCDKVLKKQAKREKLEKQSAESRRVREVLLLQNVLDNMGTDDVREDFKTGKNGALLLTEENLTQLDDWYQLISPSREGATETPFPELLDGAADHLVSYLDSKEREVVGTKYSTLRSLVQQILDCGYFDNPPSREENHTEENVEEVDAANSEAEYATPTGEEETEPDTQQTLPQPTEPAVDEALPEQTSSEAVVSQQKTAGATDDYFTQSTAEPTRNIADIVSSGSFNFLQESQIVDSPHADPAVVAAHPMAPGMVAHTDLQFTNAGLTSDQSQTVQQSSSYDAQVVVPPQAMGDSYPGQVYPTQSYVVPVNADVPPPIPYPGDTHHTSQSYVSVVEGQMAPVEQNRGDDKPFQQLNPNAPTFYSDQTSPKTGEKSEDTQYGDQQNDFQGSDGYQGQGYRRGGGQRGGRGSRGMNNGGGNYRGNNSRGNYRGTGNYSSGSSNYSGFPARNNYQPEGGYQGYNRDNRGGAGGGFKRGGGGGARDAGSNRGQGPRGGAARGGRGGNRGNYGNRNNGFGNNSQPVST